jgi:uncharacterized repeat protein (TIGR03843 family)
LTQGAVPDVVPWRELLTSGEVEVEGRIAWSSNRTYLVSLTVAGSDEPHGGQAIYKPRRGERPLWDFPNGLYRREVAAYELSEALGLGIVPETVSRVDAPLGEGSLQRFVDADFSEHYFSLLEERGHRRSLMTIAAFDLLANNADRKGGHCLLGLDGRIWAIDHGLCFHEEPKLRTVMWDFAGERLPADFLERCAEIARSPDEIFERMDASLSCDEIEALVRRARALTKVRKFPAPHPDRRPYPWPLV